MMLVCYIMLTQVCNYVCMHACMQLQAYKLRQIIFVSLIKDGNKRRVRTENLVLPITHINMQNRAQNYIYTLKSIDHVIRVLSEFICVLYL
jgi:hypothetical protein